MLPSTKPQKPARERASLLPSTGASLPGGALTLSVMEIEQDFALLLILHRGRMQRSAYTPSDAASHRPCRRACSVRAGTQRIELATAEKCLRGGPCARACAVRIGAMSYGLKSGGTGGASRMRVMVTRRLAAIYGSSGNKGSV